MSNKPLLKRYTAALLASLFIGVFLLALALTSRAGQAGILGGSSTYLPFITAQEPPPPPPVPVYVKNIPLPGAQCPNFVAVNEFSDYVYVVNNFSHSISILRGENYVTHVLSGGEWPTRIAIEPNSTRTFITNLHSLGNSGPPTPLAEFNGTSLTRTYNQKFEGYTPIFNTFNNYVYETDLDSNIRIYDANTSPMTFITDLGLSLGIRGWIIPMTFDPATGLVYAASWSHGEIYVVNGTQIVSIKDAQTWGPSDVVLDPVRKLLYIAGQEVENRPAGYPAYNISVFNAQAPYQFLGGFTTSTSTTKLDYDPISGLVYGVNPKEDSVTIMAGLQLIGNAPAGDLPYDVAVNPNTGYAFVPNQNSNNISIYREGAFVTNIDSQGVRPYALAVDTRNNYVYVANRGTEGYLSCTENGSVTILR